MSKNRGFNVSGACYPEVHQEAANMIEDIQNLKKKVDSGADQMCIRDRAQAKRKRQYRQQVNRARQNQTYQNGARHKCAVCGRTELDDPNLTFRYCSKCSGNKEYCQDHLFTHKHM